MIASGRDESGCGWLVVGVLLGPIGILLALFTGIRCYKCRKHISIKAEVCGYCGAEQANRPEP